MLTFATENNEIPLNMETMHVRTTMSNNTLFIDRLFLFLSLAICPRTSDIDKYKFHEFYLLIYACISKVSPSVLYDSCIHSIDTSCYSSQFFYSNNNIGST